MFKENEPDQNYISLVFFAGKNCDVNIAAPAVSNNKSATAAITVSSDTLLAFLWCYLAVNIADAVVVSCQLICQQDATNLLKN
jgi:hypothetical protein